MTLEDCLNLTYIDEDRRRGYFVKRGVKLGVARRFVHDIGHWVKQRGEVAFDDRNSNFVTNMPHSMVPWKVVLLYY